jgi:seryl-tRNA synthetase
VISYRKVAKAIKKYQKEFRYEYVDTPWLVSDEAVNVTLPADRHGFELGHPSLKPGKLVGSGEQGFIQMMLNGELRKGASYVTAGPCFRDEETVDRLRQYSFFKVELIRIASWGDKLSIVDAHRMARDAEDVIYQLYGPGARVVRTSEGYDLEVQGVEIGSYGIRSYQGHSWVYGTGLALPRTPTAFRTQG